MLRIKQVHCNFVFLQNDLKQKEAEQMVRHILGDIIGGMRTPERPSSPIDAYITDEEIFNRCNPRVMFT